KFKEQRNKFLEDLEGFNELAEKLNAKEQRLSWDPSSFEMLRRGEQALEPHHWLWTLAYNLDRAMKLWLKGPLFQLEPTRVEVEVRGMRKEAQRLRELFLSGGGRVYSDADHEAAKSDEQDDDGADADSPEGEGGASAKPTPATVAEQLAQQVALMADSHLGLVHSLCNKSLQPRHWDKISLLVGFSIEPDNAFTLGKIIEMEVGKHVPQLQELSESATKEHAIEVALDAMEAEWRPLLLDLEPWRETGTFVIAGSCVEEMRGVVDDHLVKTRMMRNSRHVQAWANRLLSWEEWLDSMGQILERWVVLQTSWTYLEPVFTGRDVLRQMPAEAQLFRKADKVWRGLMQKATEQRSAFQITKVPDLLEKLNESCEKLEQVQKGLEDYLDSKRISFPRFFLISNEQLLEIIIDVKDANRIQPHLRLCFPGIDGLSLPSQDSLDQSAVMLSVSGQAVESVTLDRAPDSTGFEGGVEEWFRELEVAMVAAISRGCVEALRFRANNPRAAWLQSEGGGPSQAALCASEVLRTQGIASAISSGSLPALHEQLCEDLKELGQLARSGDVRPGAWNLLSSLVSLDARHRDVVKRLIEENVTSKDDFEWLAQLRYYVEADESEHDYDVFVAMAVARHNYQFEYLGNTTRLVMTPLTARAYRSLSCALQLTYAGALEGPSGTGKTETVKDLAKALAVMCFTFTCSSAVDVQASSRFLRGTACSGAWCCLDELHRVDADVLGVMAQQVLTIQQAVLRQVNHFEFEGTTMQLRGGLLSVICPSHKGLTKVPDNLRILLRTVSMVAPDMQGIAEVRLLALGFKDPVKLAQNLTLALRFGFGREACLHSLSAVFHGCPRPHSAADETGEGEEVLLLRALWDVCLSGLPGSEMETAQELTKDIFSVTVMPKASTRHPVLKMAVREQLQVAGLKPGPYLEGKAVEMYEAMKKMLKKMLTKKAMKVSKTAKGKLAILVVLKGGKGDDLDSFEEVRPEEEQEKQDASWPTKRTTFYKAPKTIFIGMAVRGVCTLGLVVGPNGEWKPGILANLLQQRQAVQPGLAKPQSQAPTAGAVPGRKLLRQSSREFPARLSVLSEDTVKEEQPMLQQQPARWWHLDGVADPTWAEPLHPFLEDDRASMGLVSGGPVAAPSNLRLIFECVDAATASPATVARCVTVYFSLAELGYRHLVDAWHEHSCPATLERE
ncbi:unnamed protein product, partial [Polarella glacialis]